MVRRGPDSPPVRSQAATGSCRAARSRSARRDHCQTIRTAFDQFDVGAPHAPGESKYQAW